MNKELYQDCEGEDRRTFELPYGQNELIEKLCHTNKNTGVILISGNAVAMPWVKKVPAIMQSWYLGSEAGSATANVISGKVNPSGKLPFSIPKRLEDNGAHFYGDLSSPETGQMFVTKKTYMSVIVGSIRKRLFRNFVSDMDCLIPILNSVKLNRIKKNMEKMKRFFYLWS